MVSLAKPSPATAVPRSTPPNPCITNVCVPGGQLALERPRDEPVALAGRLIEMGEGPAVCLVRVEHIVKRIGDDAFKGRAGS